MAAGGEIGSNSNLLQRKMQNLNLRGGLWEKPGSRNDVGSLWEFLIGSWQGPVLSEMVASFGFKSNELCDYPSCRNGLCGLSFIAGQLLSCSLP